MIGVNHSAHILGPMISYMQIIFSQESKRGTSNSSMQFVSLFNIYAGQEC